MLNRRKFLTVASTSLAIALRQNSRIACADEVATGIDVSSIEDGEDIFDFIQRHHGRFDIRLYQKILGTANEFKEGDAIVGVAAIDDRSRLHAKELLANTRLRDIEAHPPWEDDLSRWIDRFAPKEKRDDLGRQTLGEFKAWLLSADESDIPTVLPGLTSDIIACLVRLMSNDELIAIGQKVFHPLHGSQIGAKGYLGARVQPNSPTDHLDDIRFQVFDAFAYAVGDVLLGTNPVSSDPASVRLVERALQDILTTFGIDDVIPHCVLAHIDVQADVERVDAGSTEFWFQSIAGNDAANATFDISLDKMVQYAKSRKGRFGLYLESGQGADFTNGHGHGCDMVFHESRKYGFARGLAHEIALSKGIPVEQVWLHINDVAGFIGPEVFRTKEQLVRCCLEDIVMGKLHGLTIGLDVCATLHMEISLDDLDWCLEQIAPANPAYLMALPTKIDPMLGYLTTGYQDHVRLRERFGHRVDDRMWTFFQRLGVIDFQGQPTEHFGDPNWVYLQYQRRKNDVRSDAEILAESKKRIGEIRQRGVMIAEGYGETPYDLSPNTRTEIQSIFEDAKQCIWKEWDREFVRRIPRSILISTRSSNRNDYVLHPVSGEHLSDESAGVIQKLHESSDGRSNVAIVISEGLNALAMMDEGNLLPLLDELVPLLSQSGFRVLPTRIVVDGGRVRAGYRIGEALFKGLAELRTVIHLIGERPGTGHHTLSAYLTSAEGSVWSQPDQIDHNRTKVVSGISRTALIPKKAARDIMAILTK